MDADTDSADLADSTSYADSTDSADSTVSADSTDSADSADTVSFTLLLKSLYLVLIYLLAYTWLKVEPQISRKERFIIYIHFNF